MTKKKQSALKTLFPLQEKPLYLIDWIVLLLLMAVLFVSFEMRDPPFEKRWLNNCIRIFHQTI